MFLFNFYYVIEEIKKEIKQLEIQIGCVLRYERLKKGFSQLELALKFDSNPTLIGRIERAESLSGWDKIYFLVRLLQVDPKDIYNLKSKKELLKIVSESQKLEDKLTTEKSAYYEALEKKIRTLF